ncbi:Uncharacterized protein FWK35_00005784 [Aphis craccivora]|uniref:Uncharacterized protein n=1 Tax=Aphis craccivora TaxID=307492 RepID=A0A6G0YPZ0_APHCR|nr:Uncharacterized protein FWK35_00005784 [Aphis craccivora]
MYLILKSYNRHTIKYLVLDINIRDTSFYKNIIGVRSLRFQGQQKINLAHSSNSPAHKLVNRSINFFIYNGRHLWKYNFTEAHYSIFTGRGSLKDSPGAAFAASAAPVRTPMILILYKCYIIFTKQIVLQPVQNQYEPVANAIGLLTARFLGRPIDANAAPFGLPRYFTFFGNLTSDSTISHPVSKDGVASISTA